MSTTNIRIEVPQELYLFVAKIQDRIKKESNKKISLADLILNFTSVGIQFANSDESDKLSISDKAISLGSSQVPIPGLYIASKTIFESKDDLEAERDAIDEKIDRLDKRENRLNAWEDRLNSIQESIDLIAQKWNDRVIYLMNAQDKFTYLAAEKDFLKVQIELDKQQIKHLREELYSHKEQSKTLDKITGSLKEVRQMFHMISEDTFMPAVKKYGFWVLSIVGIIIWHKSENKNKSYDAIIKDVFSKNSDFFKSMSPEQKVVFEKMMASIFKQTKPG